MGGWGRGRGGTPPPRSRSGRAGDSGGGSEIAPSQGSTRQPGHGALLHLASGCQWTVSDIAADDSEDIFSPVPMAVGWGWEETTSVTDRMKPLHIRIAELAALLVQLFSTTRRLKHYFNIILCKS